MDLNKIKDIFRPISNIYKNFKPKLTIKKDNQYLICYGRKEIDNNYGRWIVIDDLDKIKKYCEKLKPFIEIGKIPAYKYQHKEGVDLFPEFKPNLIVYCEIKDKEEIKYILEKIGINPVKFLEKNQGDKWEKGSKISLESYRQRINKMLSEFNSEIENKNRESTYNYWVNFVNFFNEADIEDGKRKEAKKIVTDISDLYTLEPDNLVLKQESSKNVNMLIEIFSRELK